MIVTFNNQCVSEMNWPLLSSCRNTFVPIDLLCCSTPYSFGQTYDEKPICQQPRDFVSFLPSLMLNFYFNQNMQRK